MTTNPKILITPDIKIYEMLKEYPQLEDKLIEIAPIFVKLKNPILRKTITKVTTLKQASIVGKVPIGDLINKLRAEIGQTTENFNNEINPGKSKPEWAEKEKASLVYDAREDLNAGVHPVNKVVKECSSLQAGEVYLLITPFSPAPLIDMIQEKGFKVYTEEISANEVHTHILK